MSLFIPYLLTLTLRLFYNIQNVPTKTVLSTVDSEFQSESSRNLVNDILPWHFLKHRQEQHQILSPKQVTGMWGLCDILLPQTDCVNPFWILFFLAFTTLMLYALGIPLSDHLHHIIHSSGNITKSSLCIDRLQN